MCSTVSPLTLFTPDRLDLVIKRRFFAAPHDTDAERLYRWHIWARTQGIEPRSWKRSVDDYVSAALALRSGMEMGFLGGCPVIVGSNDRLIDGAHRVACAAALGIDVVVEKTSEPGRAAPWGTKRLIADGIKGVDLVAVLKGFDEIRARAVASGPAASVELGSGVP